MLCVNFYFVFDVKYSIYDGFVVSVFIYLLKEFSWEQLFDVIDQVIILLKIFGMIYLSMDFKFGYLKEEKFIQEKFKFNKCIQLWGKNKFFNCFGSFCFDEF